MRTLTCQELDTIHGGFLNSMDPMALVDDALKAILLVIAIGGLCYGVYGLLD